VIACGIVSYKESRKMEDKNQIRNQSIEDTLLLAYVRGTLSGTDRVEVEQWIAQSPENRNMAEQVAALYHAQRTKERIEKRDSEAALEKVQRIKQRQVRRFYLRQAAAVAAGSALLLSIAFKTYLYNKQEVAETQYVTVQTNAGMRTDLSLPDGTLVHLNSASKLTYPIPYDPRERKVMLEGEGYFDVKSDPEHPFIVSVADDRMRIKVLGTRFNINAYPNEEEVYTTLVEGAVLLQYTDAALNTMERRLETKDEALYNLSLRHIVIDEKPLRPNEKATYNFAAKKITVREVNTANEYAWKDGKLIFKNTPMPEVLSRLSNFYNAKFIVIDSVINTYPFTGTFDNKQFFQILDYFRHTSKINYTLRQATEDDSSGTKYTIVTLTK
jgi:ferric-dicitrate binding protein FerR (iron transport regulator)